MPNGRLSPTGILLHSARQRGIKGINPDYCTVEDSVILGDAYRGEGYIFDGWYGDPGFESAVTELAGVTGSVKAVREVFGTGL